MPMTFDEAYATACGLYGVLKAHNVPDRALILQETVRNVRAVTDKSDNDSVKQTGILLEQAVEQRLREEVEQNPGKCEHACTCHSRPELPVSQAGHVHTNPDDEHLDDVFVSSPHRPR